MKVSQWIASHPGRMVTVATDTPLDQVTQRLLKESHLRDLYVTDDREVIVGRLSHEKLAKHLLAAHRPRTTRREILERVTNAPAKELMSRHFVTAHPDEDLDEVLARMIDHRVENLPVVDDTGRVLGAVNLTQVLRAYHDDRSAPTNP